MSVENWSAIYVSIYSYIYASIHPTYRIFTSKYTPYMYIRYIFPYILRIQFFHGGITSAALSAERKRHTKKVFHMLFRRSVTVLFHRRHRRKTRLPVTRRCLNEINWNFGNQREINRGSRILFVFPMNQRKNSQTQLPLEICTYKGYN